MDSDTNRLLYARTLQIRTVWSFQECLFWYGWRGKVKKTSNKCHCPCFHRRRHTPTAPVCISLRQPVQSSLLTLLCVQWSLWKWGSRLLTAGAPLSGSVHLNCGRQKDWQGELTISIIMKITRLFINQVLQGFTSTVVPSDILHNDEVCCVWAYSRVPVQECGACTQEWTREGVSTDGHLCCWLHCRCVLCCCKPSTRHYRLKTKLKCWKLCPRSSKKHRNERYNYGSCLSTYLITKPISTSIKYKTKHCFYYVYHSIHKIMYNIHTYLQTYVLTCTHRHVERPWF